MNRNWLFFTLSLGLILAACATSPPNGVSYAGGDGSSVQNAVLILNATEETGVPAEYAWLARHFPGYKRDRQYVLPAEKLCDVIEFTLPDGSKHSVYFDISKFFGKW